MKLKLFGFVFFISLEVVLVFNAEIGDKFCILLMKSLLFVESLLISISSSFIIKEIEDIIELSFYIFFMIYDEFFIEKFFILGNFLLNNVGFWQSN